MTKAKCFVRLNDLTCTTYNSPIENSTLYIPTESSDIIEYNVQVEFKDILENIIYFPTLQATRASFLNTKTGAKYELDCTFVSTDNNIHNFQLRINNQSYEDSNSNLLEIVFENSTYIGSLRLPIKVKYIRKAKRIFNYSTLGAKLIDSNLLAKRVKIGFPLWGTVNTNINSTTLKLLEPLHDIYSSIYSKTNEYLLQSFNLKYEPLVFKRVALKNYPKFITRILSNGIVEELKETSDIKAAPKKVEVYAAEANFNLFSCIYDFKRNSEATINKLINLEDIYVRLLDSSNLEYTSANIIGYNLENILINETTIIRKDMYSKLQNEFQRIVDIDCNETIEITNYVDLRYSHYINENPYISPPLTDVNLKTFKPEIVIKTNHELTNNVISFNNNLIAKGNEQYKYNIDTTKLRSLYVNDELDVIYLSTTGSNTTLNYSKLNVDYSSIVGDKTCNNNPYIELSDTNTVVGDWCDVTVNVGRLVEERNIKAFYLQIKNKDSTYFYNSEINSLTLDKTYLYTELLKTDLVSISVFVENAEPYVFSIVDEQTGVSFSAMIENYKINPITTKSLEYITNDYLIKQSDSILVVKTSSNSNSIFSSQDSKFNSEICININYEYSNQLDFVITIGDYFIRNYSTNLPKDSYCLYINKAKGNIYLYLDKIRIKELIGASVFDIKLGTSFNLSNGVLIDELVSATFTISDSSNSDSANLLPKRLLVDPNQIEYTISCDIEDLQNLTITRESDYD